MEKPFLPSFLVFLAYRLSSVFIIQTFYVPDEYWQSLEVAHNMVFGYGYLTWEWKHGLRTYLYPSVFAVAYKVLEFLHIDFVCLVVTLPRLLQAVLTAVSDQYFLLLSQNFGFDAFWTKTYLLTNWFWYYCGSRTITNTFETCLTIITLYYYPWELFMKKTKSNKQFSDVQMNEMKNKSLKYIILAALNCSVRPTAVTIWGPLVIFHLISLPVRNLKQIILKCAVPAFLYVSFTSVIVDYIWYGKILIPAYNFLVFNVFKDISSFYGVHSFHWYLTQGLPAVLGFQILLFVLGFISIIRELLAKKHNLLNQVFIIWVIIIVFNIAILSIIPHKEFRFALPLLPLMMLIAAKKAEVFSSKTYKLIWTSLLVLSFIVPTALFGIIHQRGSLQLINHLSDSAGNCSQNCLFLFLTPCHSTPLYSHLHRNVSTRFLTCEPPLDDNFYDESDDFFNNPAQWLQKYWDEKKPPTHVVFFDKVEKSVKSFLNSKGFNKKHEFFHTIFTEKNLGKYIMVYEPSQ